MILLFYCLALVALLTGTAEVLSDTRRLPSASRVRNFAKASASSGWAA